MSQICWSHVPSTSTHVPSPLLWEKTLRILGILSTVWSRISLHELRRRSTYTIYMFKRGTTGSFIEFVKILCKKLQVFTTHGPFIRNSIYSIPKFCFYLYCTVSPFYLAVGGLRSILSETGPIARRRAICGNFRWQKWIPWRFLGLAKCWIAVFCHIQYLPRNRSILLSVAHRPGGRGTTAVPRY